MKQADIVVLDFATGEVHIHHSVKFTGNEEYDDEEGWVSEHYGLDNTAWMTFTKVVNHS